MTAAEIAAKLTPAQRDALLWLPADGSARQWLAANGHQAAHKQLRGFGYADAKVDRRSCVMMRWITGEGAAVRAALAAEGKG